MLRLPSTTLPNPASPFSIVSSGRKPKFLKALAEIAIVQIGDSAIPESVERRVGAVFMPHGLGHFLGIGTHDVGGYLPGHPPRSTLPGLKLRTARILQETMVLAVEPGFYFIDHLLDGAKQNPALAPHRGYGGVRLEDVVTITHEWCVNSTLCPKTPQEIEHVMAGGKWPLTHDAAPKLRRE
jgi:Xaa-Pro dipeptidase